MSIQNRGIQQDWDVYTADDEQIGKVRESHADYLHVHHGRLFGQDEYYFPAWAVGRAADGRVSLTLTKDEIEGQDWVSRPRAGETREQRFGALPTGTRRETTTTTATTGMATGSTGMTERTARTRETAAEVETLDQREIVVPVVEERLDVTKRPVELGEVVINREVLEQEQTVPVDVAHEEVRVERRSASREATPDDLRLAGGEGLAQLAMGESIVIPLIEEVVEVRKRMMVREELVITKQRVTERHEVTETVRRVEPHIESSGSLERDVEGAGVGAATRTGASRPMGTTGAATSTTGAATGRRAEQTDDRNPLERAADTVRDKIDDARR